MKMIQVNRLADLPQEPVYASQVKSIEEAKAWGEHHQAGTVWVYIRKPNKAGVQLVTAVRLVTEEAKRIERARADLVRKAIDAVEAL